MTSKIEQELKVVQQIASSKTKTELEAKNLFGKFKNCVKFERGGWSIDIKDCKIQKEKLFSSMYNNGVPFLGHDKNIMHITPEQAKTILTEHDDHIDWYNGKAFKTDFKQFELFKDRIDKRNYPGFTYASVLDALK